MKSDIANRADIDRLISDFYKKVMVDAEIGFIFTEVAKIHLETHVPRIADFWEMVLLGNQTYQGNPVHAHLLLNEKVALLPQHFERWVQLFIETVTTLFEGEIAERAKQRAQSIATVMQIKIAQHSLKSE